MHKKAVALIFAILLVAGICGARGTIDAQETPAEATQLRLVQIFYTSADLFVDDTKAVEALQFTFTTDYMPLTPGTHQIAVAATGTEAAEGGSIALEVAEGHSYTIVTMGAFETGKPTLMVIDETSDLAAVEQTGSDAIIIQNVPDAPPVDVYFVDTLVIEDLAFGGYGVAGAPLGAFKARAAMAGVPDSTLFIADYFAVPETTAIAYLTGDTVTEVKRNFFTTSDMNVRDFLTAHVGLENSALTTFYAALESTGMLDALGSEETEGFTIFAPTNEAFAALPAETQAALLNDPEALARVIGYHISPTYALPQDLVGAPTLPTLAGVELSAAVVPDESFTVNETATVKLQMRPTNGVVYIIDTVLMPPEE